MPHGDFHARGSQHRLWLQIWFGFLAVLVVFALFAGALFWLHGLDRPERAPVVGIGSVLADLLPAADAPTAVQQAALARLHEQLHFRLALYDATGRLLATAGSAEFPSRLPAERARHWRRGKVRIDLPDGRVALAVVRAPWSRARPLAWLAVLAVTAALIAWVVARRLARRLERLQAQVIALGEGDLSARVEVHGRDEIAELAHRFNDAAARIEALVGGQRAMLAAASHELRSPLARIRMALELLDTGKRRDLHARLEHDISELDALIGELLLASRLETGSESIVRESVDLLALAREEGARSGARVDGVNVLVQGDARLLRRAVRNLLENAKRHAPAESVELTIAADDGMARITVCDRGPGVPEAERERIFEPFYRSPGTAESGSGVGLGLWLVRRIARQHGGEASCAAREGDGACFTIALPLGG